MLGIKVSIDRYISDELQPGIVEGKLEDAHGRRWSIVEKTAMFHMHLDALTSYPQQGMIAGEVVRRGIDATGREIIRFSIARHWYLESGEGVAEFDVFPESLVEF